MEGSLFSGFQMEKDHLYYLFQWQKGAFLLSANSSH